MEIENKNDSYTRLILLQISSLLRDYNKYPSIYSFNQILNWKYNRVQSLHIIN